MYIFLPPLTPHTHFFPLISSDSSLWRHLWPALSVLLPFLLFICPWDTATALCFGVKRNGFKQRWGLIQEVGYVLISPFSEVNKCRVSLLQRQFAICHHIIDIIIILMQLLKFCVVAPYISIVHHFPSSSLTHTLPLSPYRWLFFGPS